MKRNKETKNDLSRRDFIKTTAVGVGATALTGLSSTEAKAQQQLASIPQNWDYEADVVVVGFGGAGARAAIAAHDAGAKVLLLEKAPEGQEGGSTGTAGGGARTFSNVPDAINYFRALCYGTTPEEVTDTFALADQTDTYLANMKEAGVDLVWRRNAGRPAFPTLPGAMGDYGDWDVVDANGVRLNGRGLFAAFKSQVEKREIDVKYGTPAIGLIQDPASMEILGVKAESDGWERFIKAKRGVVLTCGGYEGNPEMQGYFIFPGLRFYPIGTPYSTGDGIKMVSEVGAALWHTASWEWAAFCIKAPSEILGCGVGYTASALGSYVFVNRHGNRFMNEDKGLVYRKETLELTYFDHEQAEYPNMPAYLIGERLTNTLGVGTWGANQTWYRLHSGYEWSADNSAEIAKGWIVKADTIAELAAQMGIDPAGLDATITKYNQYCAAGADPEFGRPQTRLVPIQTPPFYAFEQGISLVNTHGGPKRNAKAQILNKEDHPIPRLYSAGEFGSIWGHCGPHGYSLAENAIFGQIAGRNAAAEAPW